MTEIHPVEVFPHRSFNGLLALEIGVVGGPVLLQLPMLFRIGLSLIHIYQEAELPELGEGEAIDTSIPADPNVKNYSYTVLDGDVYYREHSCMVRPDLNATAEARVKGLVGLRECVQQLIDCLLYTSRCV